MKRAIKSKAKSGSARDLFTELSEGMEALADARHGKRTLRTHAGGHELFSGAEPQSLKNRPTRLKQ
jgi:hypothetical protein